MPRQKKKPNPLVLNNSVEDLLNQGLAIIGEEIDKIKNNKIDDLREKSSMVLLNDYLRTLVSLKREERQTAVETELSHLQDNDLNNLAKEALLYLKNTEKKIVDHND